MIDLYFNLRLAWDYFILVIELTLFLIEAFNLLPISWFLFFTNHEKCQHRKSANLRQELETSCNNKLLEL